MRCDWCGLDTGAMSQRFRDRRRCADVFGWTAVPSGRRSSLGIASASHCATAIASSRSSMPVAGRCLYRDRGPAYTVTSPRMPATIRDASRASPGNSVWLLSSRRCVRRGFARCCARRRRGRLPPARWLSADALVRDGGLPRGFAGRNGWAIVADGGALHVARIRASLPRCGRRGHAAGRVWQTMRVVLYTLCGALGAWSFAAFVTFAVGEARYLEFRAAFAGSDTRLGCGVAVRRSPTSAILPLRRRTTTESGTTDRSRQASLGCLFSPSPACGVWFSRCAAARGHFRSVAGADDRAVDVPTNIATIAFRSASPTPSSSIASSTSPSSSAAGCSISSRRTRCARWSAAGRRAGRRRGPAPRSAGRAAAADQFRSRCTSSPPPWSASRSTPG